MKNARRIPWGNLTMQTVYLYCSIYFHTHFIPGFKEVFYQMRVEPHYCFFPYH